jgi:hypothetical protein
VLGRYSCDSDFGNFSPLSSDVPLTKKYEMDFQVNILAAVEETLFRQEPLLENADKVCEDEEVTRHKEADKFCSQV